ncbi:MAG: FG-nucleoporin nsp1 [Stictis urceolatum]|nr:FG-nucleoporin nsp1 [Stictis urceolata]
MAFSFGQSSGGGNPFGSNPASSGSSSQPTTTAPLFGSAPATSATPNLFGSSTAKTSGAAPSLFGAAAPASSPFSGFKPTGAPAPGASTGGPAFPSLSTPNKADGGSGQSQKPSIFGGTTAGGGTAGSGSLFGGLGSTPATSTASTGNTTPAQSNPFSFGLSTTPAGAPPAGGGPSLFNKPDQPQGQQGQQNQQSQQTQPGQQNQQGLGSKPGLNSSFFPGTGQASSAQTPSTSAPAASPFSPGGQPASSTSNLFGGLKQNDQSSTKSTSQPSQPLFGTAPTQPTQPASTGGTGPSLFSNVNKGPSGASKPGPDMFSGLKAFPSSSAPSTRPATTSLFGSGTSAPQSSTAAQPTSSSAATPSPTFSLTSAQSASTTQPSLFAGLKGVQGGSAEATGTSAAPATTSSTTPNLFAGLQPKPPVDASKPAEPPGATQSATQPANSARQADMSKSTAFGASTAGPKPTSQSRLKNKSMDEIITRWATDLNKYQKEFQAQATKVAQWDRILVENSDKIQKLYGHTLEAERATIEVERQLSAVENDQNELEYWLDTYEKQVEEMTATQVGSSDSLSGPDQERERTYKLAEKLSDRLDEMGKDLNGMVEEINDASSHLTKNSKPDDPLSQIVKVLNGHLSQLQHIDQGTAALQAKVVEAQKASRSLGATSGNGLGNDSASDFYRSYTRGR